MLSKEIIKKLQRSRVNPSLYLPIIQLFLNEKKPLYIKTASRKLGMSYDVTKQRLRKMELTGFLKRGKRGVYSIPEYLEKFNVEKEPYGKAIIVNGALRSITNAVRFQIYCSALTKACKGKFCSVKQIDGNTLVVRPSNQFVGRKMHPLKAMATAVILSSEVFLEKRSPNLERKNKRVDVKFYPGEWGISLGDALGTENIKDGELGEELSRYGEIRKGSRGAQIKTDLIFETNGKKVHVELTQTKKGKKESRSNIKAMEIQSRLYYGVKSFNKYGILMFIVIDKGWENVNWLLKEINFLEENRVKILFTDFEGEWAKTVSNDILTTLKETPASFETGATS